MNPNQNQQGDIRLEKIDSLPAGCKLIKRSQNGIILAESQVTNNRHYLLDRSVKLFEAPDKTRYLLNAGEENAELLHSKDHGAIRVAPGVHRVGVVNEIDHLTGMVAPVED